MFLLSDHLPFVLVSIPMSMTPVYFVDYPREEDLNLFPSFPVERLHKEHPILITPLSFRVLPRFSDNLEKLDGNTERPEMANCPFYEAEDTIQRHERKITDLCNLYLAAPRGTSTCNSSEQLREERNVLQEQHNSTAQPFAQTSPSISQIFPQTHSIRVTIEERHSTYQDHQLYTMCQDGLNGKHIYRQRHRELSIGRYAKKNMRGCQRWRHLFALGAAVFALIESATQYNLISRTLAGTLGVSIRNDLSTDIICLLAYTTLTACLYHCNADDICQDHWLITGIVGGVVVGYLAGMDLQIIILYVLPWTVLGCLCGSGVMHDILRRRHVVQRYYHEGAEEGISA